MGGPKERRHFAVEKRLPKEIRAQLDRLLIEDFTYDELKAWTEEQGYEISRSAIARYGKHFLEAFKRLRLVEEQAAALVGEAGEGLSLEEAASKLFAERVLSCLISGDYEPGKLPAMMAGFSRLQSSSVQREKLKAELAKKAAAAVDSIEAVAGASLPAEALQKIKEEVYSLVG